MPVMSARLLDGESVAARMRSEVAGRVAMLRAAGVRPGLGTILVGDDPASARYVAMKHADCEQVGMASVHAHLPADVSQGELEATIARFNQDPTVHAYLVQVPLPAGLDEHAALAGGGPGQGCRRLASREPGSVGDGQRRVRCLAHRRESWSCWRPSTCRWKESTWW